MKKALKHFFIGILVLASWLIPQAVYADSIVEKFAAGGAFLVLKFISFLTGFSGLVLNFVVKLTVVDMGKNLANYPIESTWTVVRDLANMGFIFILLAAAIQMILGVGTDTRKIIVNLIIAAIFINFSLFFTKVVIDASNILAVTFYDAIAPGALTGDAAKTGLSNSMMEPLRLQSMMKLAESDVVGVKSIITVGIMGSIFLLITSFVFLAVAIMLIIRYVVLIFVLILSPLALITLIFPDAKSYFNKWKAALINQAFFAPIYFLLTWIVIKIFQDSPLGKLGDLSTAIGGAVTSNGNQLALTTNFGVFDTVVNFMVIIAFLIVSLMVAKNMSSKSADGFNKLTGWAMGAAGGATLGVAGWTGRKTIGAVGSSLGDSEKLKAAAAKGGATGMAARLALATSRKTAGASFDIRATGLGKTLDAGKAQKGGYTQDVKDSAKKMKEFGDSLGPSDIVKDEAKQDRERLRKEEKEIREKAQKRVDSEFVKPSALTKFENNIEAAERMAQNQTISEEARSQARTRAEELRKQAEPIKQAYERRRQERIKSIVAASGIENKRKEAEEKADRILGVNEEEAKKRLKEQGWTDEKLNKPEGRAAIKAAQVKAVGDERKEGYAQAITEKNRIGQNQVPFLGKIKKSHRQAAADLRKGGRKVEDIVKEALKASGEVKDDKKDDRDDEGTKPEEGADKPKT